MSTHAPVRLSRDDYLARVRANVAATDPEALDAAVQFIRWRLGSEKDDTRLRQGLEAFLLGPANGHSGLLELYDIGQARAALARTAFEFDNWHYDRTARVLMVNLRRGSHESLSGALYNAYRGRDAEHQVECAAESFISEGLGWFMSSVSNRPLKAANVRLDAQEKVAFQSVQFRDLWPNPLDRLRCM